MRDRITQIFNWQLPFLLTGCGGNSRRIDAFHRYNLSVPGLNRGIMGREEITCELQFQAE